MWKYNSFHQITTLPRYVLLFNNRFQEVKELSMYLYVFTLRRKKPPLEEVITANTAIDAIALIVSFTVYVSSINVEYKTL